VKKINNHTVHEEYRSMTMKSNIKNLQGIRAIVSLVALVLIVELGFNALPMPKTKTLSTSVT
jgi:hypothetical protein